MAVFHLAAMSKVARIGKGRRDGAVGLERCVPAAVVEVEMGVEDNVHLFWSNSSCGKRARKKFLIALDFTHLRGLLVADSGFDQDSLLSSSDNDSVEPQQNAVLFVRRRALLP